MKKVLLALAVIILAILVAILVFRERAKAPVPNDLQVTQAPASKINKSKYSVDDPASPWIIVNKKRPLPASYAPADLQQIEAFTLRAEAKEALSELLAGSKNAYAPLRVISGFRAFASQQNVYNAAVAKDGKASADMYSARAGHSEHQTGWAADVGNASGECDFDICFGDTNGSKWLREHAHEYGFIVRYPKGKENLTGYQDEPWHIRYVGKELASELKRLDQTMEQFFSLPASTSY